MKEKGLSGCALKIIAIITMLIDHIGATVVYELAYNKAPLLILDQRITEQTQYNLEMLYTICRTIGRVAFPIFCFLLLEGFIHTSSRLKYCIRLGIFAIISEIPFELAVHGSINLGLHNVFFTLLIGILCMWACDAIEKYVIDTDAFANNSYMRQVSKLIIWIAVTGSGMIIAQLLDTDYSAFGVASMMIMYMFRENKTSLIICGAVSFLWSPVEMPTILGFVPIALYNGTRGRQIKYFFYAFYPVHLTILYFITKFIAHY